MFNGHLDTVPVCEGWSKDPFTPVLKDGLIIGLGSMDMKGGIACSLGALKALIESDMVTGNLAFSGVIDEEGYSKGAKAVLNTELKKADAIIIGEPFFGDSEQNFVPIGITGKILYKITVHGLSAHGFNPEKGINAIDDAAKIVASLDQLKLGTHPNFTKGSICTLKFTGGYEKYSVVIPDLCTIIINRLMVPGETKEGVMEDMQQFIDSLALSSKVDVKNIPPFYDPYEIRRDEQIMRCFETAYQEIRGTLPIYGYRLAITDANVFMGQSKIPTINFGPKGGNSHGPNEYVEVNSLLDATRIQAQTTLNFLQQSSA